ncbi:MAG: hypothetical protein AB7K24_34040 [Gemmataceae bacterium]
MPCLLGCLALFAPRVVIILVAIFSNYIGESFTSWVWPVLGFFFLPMTTLAYAWAWHLGGQQVEGVGLVIVIVAILFDLGLLGAGEHSRRRRWREG